MDIQFTICIFMFLFRANMLFKGQTGIKTTLNFLMNKN